LYALTMLVQLYVMPLDRLARNPIHLAIVAEECQKNGVELLFVTEPLDNSPEGQPIRYVKGFAAQIEREKIRERTLRGKHMRAAQGKLPQGTGRGAYGYSYDPSTGKRVIVESEAEQVRRIFKLCIEGHSFHGIATMLNKEGIPAFGGGRWHPLTIRRMVTNPIYAGLTYYGKTKRIPLGGKRRKLENKDASEWILIQGATPAIISMEEFKAAQEAIKLPKRINASPNNTYFLRGHIYCSYCGTRLTGSTLQRRYRYYYCRKTRPDYAFPERCEARYIKADPLESDVWEQVCRILEQPEVVLAELRRRKEKAVPFLDRDIAKVQQEIRSTNDQERRLVRLYQYGQIDDEFILKQVSQLKQKRENLENELARLQQQKASIHEIERAEEKVLEYCYRVRRNLRTLNFEEKRHLLDALSIKVIVYKDKVELQGAIPSYVTTARTSA